MYNAQEFLDLMVAYEDIPLPMSTDLKKYNHNPIFNHHDYITALVKADSLRFSQKKSVKYIKIFN